MQMTMCFNGLEIWYFGSGKVLQISLGTLVLIMDFDQGHTLSFEHDHYHSP